MWRALMREVLARRSNPSSIANCAACQYADVCQACNAPFALSNNTCVCPPGYLSSGSTCALPRRPMSACSWHAQTSACRSVLFYEARSASGGRMWPHTPTPIRGEPRGRAWLAQRCMAAGACLQSVCLPSHKHAVLSAIMSVPCKTPFLKTQARLAVFCKVMCWGLSSRCSLRPHRQ